jgi:hypothetical protein
LHLVGGQPERDFLHRAVMTGNARQDNPSACELIEAKIRKSGSKILQSLGSLVIC